MTFNSLFLEVILKIRGMSQQPCPSYQEDLFSLPVENGPLTILNDCPVGCGHRIGLHMHRPTVAPVPSERLYFPVLKSKTFDFRVQHRLNNGTARAITVIDPQQRHVSEAFIFEEDFVSMSALEARIRRNNAENQARENLLCRGLRYASTEMISSNGEQCLACLSRTTQQGYRCRSCTVAYICSGCFPRAFVNNVESNGEMVIFSNCYNCRSVFASFASPPSTRSVSRDVLPTGTGSGRDI